MRLFARVWCWVAGHDWVRLLSHEERASARPHHAMAGHMGYCARCGYFWDDLPVSAPPREELGGDPYRTPGVPALSACKCTGGGEERIVIHPDCPRHVETGRQVPRPPRSPAKPQLTGALRYQVNGRDVTFSEWAKAMREMEGTWKVLQRGFDDTFSAFDKTFSIFNPPRNPRKPRKGN